MQVTELQAVMTAKIADAALVVLQPFHTRMWSLRHGKLPSHLSLTVALNQRRRYQAWLSVHRLSVWRPL